MCDFDNNEKYTACSVSQGYKLQIVLEAVKCCEYFCLFNSKDLVVAYYFLVGH